MTKFPIGAWVARIITIDSFLEVRVGQVIDPSTRGESIAVAAGVLEYPLVRFAGTDVVQFWFDDDNSCLLLDDRQHSDIIQSAIAGKQGYVRQQVLALWRQRIGMRVVPKLRIVPGGKNDGNNAA